MKVALIADGRREGVVKEARALCSAARAWPGSWERELWLFQGSGEMAVGQDYPVDHLVAVSGEGRVTDMICLLERERRPDALLLYGDDRGEELGARLGIRLGCPAVNGVNHICWNGKTPYVKRDIYSYNLTGVFSLEKDKNILIISPSAYAADERKGEPDLIRWRWTGEDNRTPYVVEREEMAAENGLEQAKIVLVCGRGAEDKDAFEKIGRLAAGLSGAVGGTRPFVLDGWVSGDRMVGISGRVTAPRLCLVFGASGAAPFMIGVNKSDLLIGVNRDPQALLFHYCDAGIVGDCGEIAEELLKLMG